MDVKDFLNKLKQRSSRRDEPAIPFADDEPSTSPPAVLSHGPMLILADGSQSDDDDVLEHVSLSAVLRKRSDSSCAIGFRKKREIDAKGTFVSLLPTEDNPKPTRDNNNMPPASADRPRRCAFIAAARSRKRVRHEVQDIMEDALIPAEEASTTTLLKSLSAQPAQLSFVSQDDPLKFVGDSMLDTDTLAGLQMDSLPTATLHAKPVHEDVSSATVQEQQAPIVEKSIMPKKKMSLLDKAKQAASTKHTIDASVEAAKTTLHSTRF